MGLKKGHEMVSKKFYTPNELADILNIGKTKMYELLQSRQIKSKKIGRKYIIPEYALDKWIESAFVMEDQNEIYNKF